MYEKYKEIRDSRGLTDYAVSKATGISKGTLSDWKAGRYEPKLVTMLKIAGFFGVDINLLLPDYMPEKEGGGRKPDASVAGRPAQ